MTFSLERLDLGMTTTNNVVRRNRKPLQRALQSLPLSAVHDRNGQCGEMRQEYVCRLDWGLKLSSLRDLKVHQLIFWCGFKEESGTHQGVFLSV